MVKILFVFSFLFSSNLFAIEFFQSGDLIEAAKINEIISNSMRIYEKSGTNGFITSSTSKSLVPGRTVVIEKSITKLRF